MREDLKLSKEYDGFLFLAESMRNPPLLKSHHHDELELNLVIRGAVTYVVGGKRFTFPQRTLLWMFPSQEHQLIDRTRDAQYYVAVFKPLMITRCCRTKAYEGLRRKRAPGEGVLNTVLDPETFDVLRRTMDVLMEGSLDSDLLNREGGFGAGSDFQFRHRDPEGLNAGLRHLLLLGWRSQRGGGTPCRETSLHPSVSRVLEILADEEHDSGVAELARMAGMSEAYLSRTFHRQMGISLSHYRNTLRLSRFWNHYRATQHKNLTEAAFAAGFGSYAQFYRVFAQTYGGGPRHCLEATRADSIREQGSKR